ncbi:MAG: type II secretion system F family protein [Planctomycetia bacterium]|nr:type II secretion system F family protein [Planctomycetia bacterium]
MFDLFAQANLTERLLAAWPAASVLLPLAGFATVAGGCVAAMRLMSPKRSRLDERLSQPERNAELTDEENSMFGSLTPALAAQLPESKRDNREFRRMLRGAGLYRPDAATTIYALRFVLLVVPLLIAGLLAVVEPVHALRIMLCGGAIAAALSIAPRLWVYFRRRARLAQIRQGLPDTMDMLAMCMDGGVSLSASLSQVAKRLDSYPAIAEELLIVKRQAEVSSLKRALADLSDRVELPEVRGLSALLARGDRLGTQLSGSLIEQSDHMRTQRRQRATMQANKTPVKLVLPLMFCFAPAALILLTGPAVLELKEMLAPSSGHGVFTENNKMDTSRRSGILGTLEQLDQTIDQSGG